MIIIISVLHNPPYPAYNVGHAMSWLLQCARAVAYLHSLKPYPILHRLVIVFCIIYLKL